MYIVVEGPGGAGKGVQIKRLEARLSAVGKNVTTTREPGGTFAAEQMREELFRRKALGQISFEEEIEILYAARGLNMRQIVLPYLKMVPEAVVLKDRDYFSTIMYQMVSARVAGMAYDEAKATLDRYHRLEYAEKGFPEPDLRIMLLPSEEVCMARKRNAGHQGDGFDMQAERVLRQIYENYAVEALDIARGRSRFRRNTVVVDGGFDPSIVEEMIWREVSRKFGLVDEAKEGKVELTYSHPERGLGRSRGWCK